MLYGRGRLSADTSGGNKFESAKTKFEMNCGERHYLSMPPSAKGLRFLWCLSGG